MLFERNPLDADTGLQKQRWAQEGSTLWNDNEGISSASEETIYSVPTGKVLYVTDVVVQIVSSNTSANDYGYLEDGNGGTQKLSIEARSYSGGEVIPFNFSSPLVFETSIYWAHGSPSINMSANLTFSGWLENA